MRLQVLHSSHLLQGLVEMFPAPPKKVKFWHRWKSQVLPERDDFLHTLTHTYHAPTTFPLLARFSLILFFKFDPLSLNYFRSIKFEFYFVKPSINRSLEFFLDTTGFPYLGNLKKLLNLILNKLNVKISN